ncbi:lysoplasmalogenase [Parasphingopyxis algicola]|uniref:lysoplasmalogenase family protein n=1 Tax=Parasphingopyxis algicola TaxID=2026624 RepID=UPI0015A1FD75|nr:lysoplasmalogenase family protein [Parasphingopyxis algicola]QLC24199.1 lysoplasmalogenase [Parasphingopyxis algicola]
MTEESSSKAGDLAPAVLVIALLAGLSYYLATRFMEPSALLIAWKGAGVGLLAVWAAMQARSLDGWLLALVMALGATGDVLLDAVGTVQGGMAFMAGHLIAITLFFRNRRSETTLSQKLLAVLLVPVVIWLSWTFPADRGMASGVALYATPLAFMAALAWISRFSRYLTGIGALLFVVSDLLIFARMGPLASSLVPGLLIWPLYFTGQAMIAIGVVKTLAGRDPA